MDYQLEKRLYRYQVRGAENLRDAELADYIWLVELLLQELRQRAVILRNTPINTPAGSPE